MELINKVLDILRAFANDAPYLAGALGVLCLLLLAFVVHRLTRYVLVRAARRLASQTASKWDDALIGHRLFRNLSHIVPAFIVYFGVDWFDELPEKTIAVIKNVSVGYGVLFLVLAAGALIWFTLTEPARA